MRSRFAIAAGAVIAYVSLSSLLHYVLFPEPGPEPSDLPRAGTTIVNEGIASRFVFRRTSIETGGRYFEWDNFVDPGGGPIDIPHVHPHLREIFRVVDGELRFVVDGEERVVAEGSRIVAEPGSVHAFQNSSDRPAHRVSRFEATGEGPWEQLARAGLLADMGFVQADRAGGIGRIGPIQALAYSSRSKQACLPDLPIWDAAAFLVAPTARLFGVRAYYPPAELARSAVTKAEPGRYH